MLCESCRKKIIPMRTFKNIFSMETHHICERCYMKVPIHSTHQVIPIEEGEILWYNLLKERVDYPLGYMSFIKSYIWMFMNLYPSYLFIYVDEVSMKLFDLLDSLKLGNIFLVSLYENIDKKGE